MPDTATYSHYYSFGTTDPRTLTDYTNLSANTVSNTLTDDQDGNPDGVIAVGDFASWSASSVVEILGFTDAGFPVFVDSGFYYIATSSGNLHNTPLNISETTYTMCFAAGTLIATPSGSVAVEQLAAGMDLVTAEGVTTPVKWIGRKTVHKLFSGLNMQPVCIKADALGAGVPNADLVVTADHGMIVDGYVVNASALINGTTIDWLAMAELPMMVTYYHIETENHDVILANDAPAETFVDAVTRAGFDNHQEYLDLFGVDRVIPEMPMLRISAQRLLPASVRARLGIGTDQAEIAKRA